MSAPNPRESVGNVGSPDARWREPNSLLPLRWGTYTGRYLAGLLFIIAGLVVLDGANTFVVPFLLVGTVVHTAGWLIFPGPGLRRVWVAGPSLACVWLLLVGPQVLAVMAIPFLGWLIVRQRPARSYITVLFVIVTGVMLSTAARSVQNEAMWFGIEAAVVVASAWLARWLAGTKRQAPTADSLGELR